MTDPVIVVDELRMRYLGAIGCAVDGISFTVAAGRSSDSSARTARASPPPSESSPDSAAATTAGPTCHKTFAHQHGSRRSRTCRR
jgi:hypothetical protein